MKPILIVMAAGMGSRYGGLKQLDPVGPSGELIIDYSIYDAIKAGFGRVIFVITEQIDETFREMIGDRVSRVVPVDYVYQTLEDLPPGCDITVSRSKPWGTAQAVYCCRGKINGPFAVINSDDFYGAGAYQKVCEFISRTHDGAEYSCCMAGYSIENTLTEHGHVARGVCRVTDDGYLAGINERLQILRQGDGIVYIEDGGVFTVEPGTTVSMNMWGFPGSVMPEYERQFRVFLSGEDADLTKAEFLLPRLVDSLLKQKKASVKVLKTDDKWYGVTYREDKEYVVSAIAGLVGAGKYPERLWEDQ